MRQRRTADEPNLHPFTCVSSWSGDNTLPLAASARLCLLPHCTLMRVVIQWRFPLADVLSSPGHSSNCRRHRQRLWPFRTRFDRFPPRCPQSFGVIKITTHVASQKGLADQQRLHPEPLNQPDPLDPPFTGCVKVLVVVARKPAGVQQDDSLQQNTRARAAACAL